ncbi:hypothetical protein F0562_019932 [Nyssa sinensis]|uniref:Tafazzin family protein n=1 Tax=Nyssa sinensis TaxID=561372 RepID=A0A5J5BQL8_9ASTE|nr:hypothetical protein F0562_019932 [Nyssa sinensis]
MIIPRRRCSGGFNGFEISAEIHFLLPRLSIAQELVRILMQKKIHYSLACFKLWLFLFLETFVMFSCMALIGSRYMVQRKLHQALLHRPKNKPLVTVSNHVASMDDPLVIASLIPPSALLNAHSLRWTLCATDRCFRNPATSAFFRCVKVLPVSRGDGIYQKGMDMAISKLNSGGWVHIFPEGSRSRDGGRTMGSAKRGVGRLVLDADNIPMVVPFVHTGMQEIMPIGAKFPRIGKTVTILIGDPIHFDDLLDNMDENRNVSRENIYDAVSSRIGNRLQELKVKVDRLAIEQSQNSRHCTDRAAEILQQIDWESLGMGSYIVTEDESVSLKQDFHAELKINPTHPEESNSPDRYIRMGFSYEGGIMSRIRGYMDPTELMGFAARGIFMNHRVKENRTSDQGIGPLKAWNNFWKLAHHDGITANTILPYAILI